MSDADKGLWVLWAYLSSGALLWLTVTIAAWIFAERLARVLGQNPLANPVLVSVIIVATILHVSQVKYEAYFEGAKFIHFLLGPATVALASPIVRNIDLIAKHAMPIGVTLVVSSAVAILSVIGIAQVFELPADVIISLAPKSATAAVAMGISQDAGGDASLTAVMVITTGIVGAVIVTPLMNLLRIRNYAARGFAAGLAAHGIGTVRAFAVHPVAGLFSAIAMGLNGIVTAILVPLILGWAGYIR